MGAQGVQKIMGYSKSNLVTEVTAAEAKARQIAGRRYISENACSCRSGQVPLLRKGPARAIPRARCACRLLKGSERKIAPVTVSSPSVIEIKLDRLIDDMRLLRSQMIAFDKQLKGIEASLKPSEQQPESKSRPWFAAAASATARTVLILFAVGAATGAALLYLGT